MSWGCLSGLEHSITSERPPARPARPAGRTGAVAAGLLGGSLGGLLFAAKTLQLNHAIAASIPDTIGLLVTMAGLYALLGTIAGAVIAAVLLGLSHTPAAPLVPRYLMPATGAALVGVPVLWAGLLLVAEELVSYCFLGSPLPLQLLCLLLLIGAGTGIGRLWHKLIRSGRMHRHRHLVAAGVVVILGVAIVGISRITLPARQYPAPVTASPQAVVPRDDTPYTLVLLCIDGATPEVIQAQIAAGHLPTFKRLQEEGVWGPLATIHPTLSPVVWTTIATGKPPQDHGIRGFVTYRLPLLRQPLQQLPKHSGLSYHLFPALQAATAHAFRRSLCTSNMRRVRPLWSIIGDHLPVGVYHWLVTWPVEPVNGFMVASHVYAGRRGWQPAAGDSNQHDRLTLFPADAFAGLNRRERQLEPPAEELIAEFARPGETIASSNQIRRMISNSLSDPTIIELPLLLQRYRPVFTAAAFYSVDAVQHLCGHDHVSGGRWENAVVASYRHTDAMLARLLAVLGPDTNVIIVSDHGYDFQRNHHDDAPPGVLFARGPAFAAGKRVDGLSVSDIAPLCLDLVGLPIAEDMPGAGSAEYRRILSEQYRSLAPIARIATYEGGPAGDRQATPTHPDESEVMEQLRALGYLK